MSTNLASIFVGLGYDLSALEKGAPEAFRLINTQTMGMSAEMKRASREGAESLRLIDEALGIHLSRPLTRILTQEFPGLAKGLQSVLGAGVFGALAVAGFEFFDKITKSIEKAMKAQEAMKSATENTDKIYAEELAAYKDKDKAVTAATAAVDRLAEAEQKQAKATQEASGFWTSTLASIGNFAHQTFSSASTLNIEKINAQLAEFKSKFDQLALADSINGTSNAAKLLRQELASALETYVDLQIKAENIKAGQQANPLLGRIAGRTEQFRTPTAEEIAAAKQYADALERIQKVLTATEAGVHKQEADALALQRQAEAAKDLENIYRTIGESTRKLVPETDPLKKLGDEIHQMRFTAEKEFSDLEHSTNNALQLTAARAALRDFETRLDHVLAQATSLADVVNAKSKLPATIPLPATSPVISSTPVTPQLGAGGTAAAEFDKFSGDTAAQLKLAAQAYQEILTPQQKYDLQLKEINLLLQEHLIDQTAATAAIQKAREEMSKATDQLQKLLEKTNSAAAGMQAFFLQLENQGGKNGNGAFTFEILNKGLQGFEDQTVKALTGGKTEWKKYFAELDQMALKFFLNKEIAGLFKGVANSSIGQSLGLNKLLGGAAGGIGQSAAETANTTAVTALTAAVTSLTAVMSSSGAGTGLGSGGGAQIGDLSDSGASAYASGTDFAPGGMALVGEEGPELVNLPTGASVTPNASLRSGINVPIHIDARGGEIGVEQKIARALAQATPMIVASSVAQAHEITRRTAGRS